MPNSQRIGLFLSDEKIVLVEANRNKPQKAVSFPLPLSTVPKETRTFVDVNNEEVQIVALFQKMLRENKIDAGQVCVSIPTKEVFLRSFVIPWMPTNEINNVVFFEAKKYVPFDLKLLDYVYKAVPFVENKQKRLRIVFYGVRKQTLEKYDRILKQVNCKPVVYEPSLVSLAKQLITNGYLRQDQRAVVIYFHENYGQIVFYEKGVSYFFREFPFTVTDAQDPKALHDMVRDQLFREIRKSFEYYNRQFSKENIKDVLIISTVLDKELVGSLTEELSIKARVVESVVNVGLQKFVDKETICASGACITEKFSGFASFNFMEAKTVTQTPEPSKDLPWYVTELLNWNASDFTYALQTAVVCMLILGMALAFSRLKLGDMRKQDESLTQRQGALAGKDINAIKADIQHNEDKIKNYKRVLEPSHMAAALVALSQALPAGVWLDSANVRYSLSDRLIIDLNGRAYLKNMVSEFKAVNEFLSNLKASIALSKINFKTNAMESHQEQDKYMVVSFSISGS